MDNEQPPLPFGEQCDFFGEHLGSWTYRDEPHGNETDDSDGPVPGHTSQGWRLDDHTRSIGRRGVAAARALLQGTGRAA